MKKFSLAGIGAMLMFGCGAVWAEGISGVVKDDSGKPLRGVLVSAIVGDYAKNVTVFSQADGSFKIDGLKGDVHQVRARKYGLEDNFVADVVPGSSNSSGLAFSMAPAEEPVLQRTADTLLSQLKFDDARDKENFKMYCTYCHQVGTAGFRAPEEPVDWETMITRMDGFGGLEKHVQQTLVERLHAAYSEEAIEKWPEYDGPAPVDDEVLSARITEWDVGYRENITGPRGDDPAAYGEAQLAFMHDLEPGIHGKFMYGTEGRNGGVVSLDLETDKLLWHFLDFSPHSLEPDENGDMWFTLSGAGQMAKWTIETNEVVKISSKPGALRGKYPHTLRIAPDTQFTWYTDAGANAVYSIHPDPPYEVTAYELLSADQAVGGGKGEAQGITPYGLDVAPDGMIWYAKLNGNRIGRIDPNVEGGDLKEWIPPFRGPRRLHVAKDGIVWVPGWGSGVLGRFDPETEEWEVFPMPNAINRLPYAINIHPTTGDIWITGTGSDTLIRFDIDTEHYTEYPMPSHVTFMREIEFDQDGNIWTTNSNSPLRHTERGFSSFIRLETGPEISGKSEKMAKR